MLDRIGGRHTGRTLLEGVGGDIGGRRQARLEPVLDGSRVEDAIGMQDTTARKDFGVPGSRR